MTCGAHLVTAANVAVRQRAGHELIEHNPIGVDIRLEAVGVRVLHTDHLSRLQWGRPDQAGGPRRSANGQPHSQIPPATLGTTQITHVRQSTRSLDTPIWHKHSHPHSAPPIPPQSPKLLPRWPQSSLAQLTIHSTEPEGCSKGWAPLHRVFTVARPKSPIFTVSPSCRKMSTRVKGHYRSSQQPHLPS